MDTPSGCRDALLQSVGYGKGKTSHLPSTTFEPSQVASHDHYKRQNRMSFRRFNATRNVGGAERHKPTYFPLQRLPMSVP